MTQEEKAKAYDEAIEQLRAMMPNWENLSYNGKTFLQDLVHIIPELKESEDERIRKAIHIYLDWLDGRNKDYQPKGDYSIKDMIAWFEKQGEKKPQRMISAEAKEAMYDKPAWSEDDEDFMYDTLSNLTELKDRYGEGYGNVGKCIDWLKSIKQRIGG